MYPPDDIDPGLWTICECAFDLHDSWKHPQGSQRRVGPFTFTLRLCNSKTDGNGVLKGDLRVEVQSLAMEHAKARRSDWFALCDAAYNSGLRLRGHLDGGVQSCFEEVKGWIKGEQLRTGGTVPLHWGRRAALSFGGERNRVQTVSMCLWLLPDCNEEERITALLPLHYTSASPLPPPFVLPRVPPPPPDYTRPLLSLLTSTPFDVLFLVPSTNPTVPPTRFFAHQSLFSSAFPYFAALFASSESTARRSIWGEREDIDIEQPTEVLPDEEDEEMEVEGGNPDGVPAAGSDGQLGQHASPTPSVFDIASSRSPSPVRSRSPTPEKPLSPSIRLVRVEGFVTSDFEFLHAYVYEREAGRTKPKLPAATPELYRIVEHFASGGDLEQQVLAALKESLGPQDAISQLFTPYTRYFPMYRRMLFQYIDSHLGELDELEEWKTLRDGEKEADWKTAVWGLLADYTKGRIYQQ
ncbi:hypothetical protein JCM10213_003430 [Rhodosporidiobolus nylandii]